MLKAILFDDEYIVLEGLAAMVDWRGMGIELAGTAEDGVSALTLFRSVQPDIVLTDIRMPGLDGLRLIEEMMKESPDICCIVFSGFNEFDYVKRAIELGVTGYIEKPITEASIEQTLRKAIQQIEKRNETKEMAHKLETSHRELLAKATWDLLLFGEEAAAGWLELYGASMPIRGVTVLASSARIALPENLDYRVVHVQNGHEHLAVVIHMSERGLEDIARMLDLSGIPIGAGCTYRDLSDAATSCQEARQALKTAAFLEIKRLVPYHELEETMTASLKQLTEREEAIIISLKAGNKSLLMDEVERFVAWIRAARISPDLAEREMLKLIYGALEIAGHTGSDFGNSPQQPYMPHAEIREMAIKGKLAEWFRQQIEMIADSGKAGDDPIVYHAAIEKARQYIERNIARDISLQEVADHVGMNATYLSVLFKESMGESYIRYVTKTRMELAKSMLSKGYKVNEVSEKVGYMTTRHFSDVFKKYTGLTPGQYKDT